MQAIYPIYYKDENIGEARLTPIGLYYQVDSKCKLVEENMLRIVANCDGRKESLGLCVPMGQHMESHSRVSRKRLEALRSFTAVAMHEKETRVPLTEGTPVLQLSAITDAHIEVDRGKLYLIIRKA